MEWYGTKISFDSITINFHFTNCDKNWNSVCRREKRQADSAWQSETHSLDDNRKGQSIINNFLWCYFRQNAFERKDIPDAN